MTTESTLFALCACLLVAFLWLSWRYRRLARIARATLGRADLGRIAVPDRDNPTAGGKPASVTILFIDIRDFTVMSEGKTRDEMAAFLNSFFSVLIPILEEHGGWVSAFLGDGLMAVFHADDRNARPILATVALVRAVRENWGAWKGRGYGELRVGIGLHRGIAYVGVIGCPTRFTYTAVGESANIAARLESATKAHGCSILISESAYTGMSPDETVALRADASVEVHALSPILLKGHSRPINVYAVLVKESHESLPNDHIAGTELDLRNVRPESAAGHKGPPVNRPVGELGPLPHRPPSPPPPASPPPPPPR